MKEAKYYGVDGTTGDKEKGIPNSLFLYRKADEFAEQIVAKQQLYFSSPLNFNDPFECSKEDAETEGKKGILCLSGVNPAENTLMWAHYADKHKGLCFEFNFEPSNVLFHPEDKNNIGLYYDNQKITDDIFWCKIKSVEYDIANPIVLLTKDKVWNYEKEYRIIADYDNEIKNNYYQRTFIFEKHRLRKIYFGVNALPDTIEKYKSLCAICINDNSHKVELYRMEKLGQFLFKEPIPIYY